MQERRTAERVQLNLGARWEGLRTQGRGAVSDLSSSGCFVLSGGEVTVGELIRLEINFPDEPATVWGRVVYSVAEIGFALRFAFGNEDEQRALARLIDRLN
jgi:hypothetical protein